MRTRHSVFQCGFTLVETIITVAIFAVIMTIVGAAFLSSLNLQRRALNLQQVEENASYILEVMAKEIRVSELGVGVDTTCTAGTTLQMTHPVHGTIVYSLSGGVIQRTVNGFATAISSNTVEFERLQFCVSGTAANDNLQPRVTILARVRSTKTREQASVDIQTTISQRTLVD